MGSDGHALALGGAHSSVRASFRDVNGHSDTPNPGGALVGLDDRRRTSIERFSSLASRDAATHVPERNPNDGEYYVELRSAGRRSRADCKAASFLRPLESTKIFLRLLALRRMREYESLLCALFPGIV